MVLLKKILLVLVVCVVNSVSLVSLKALCDVVGTLVALCYCATRDCHDSRTFAMRVYKRREAN